MALACFGFISEVPASIRYMPLDRMAVESDAILVGRVVGKRSEMGLRHDRIYTYVTIEVDRYLKGGGGKSLLTLRLLGGSAKGYRLIVSGMPQFALQEDVLVFVEETRGRVPGVFGWSAGKFSLARRAGTGELMLHRTLAGLTVQNAGGNPGIVAPAVREPATLAEVEALINEALGSSP